ATDDARVTDRDVHAPQLAVEHDDVGHPRQRQLLDDVAAVAVEHDERATVGGAEEAAAVEPETVGSLARHRHCAFDLGPYAVDHRDLGWVADVRVDAAARLVVECPA